VKGHSNKGLNLKQLHKNLGHFFVEWWWHPIQIHQRPMSGHIDCGPQGCLSQRSSKCLLHLAEHRAKKDWLGDVLAFLISDQH